MKLIHKYLIIYIILNLLVIPMVYNEILISHTNGLNGQNLRKLKKIKVSHTNNFFSSKIFISICKGFTIKKQGINPCSASPSNMNF